MPDSPEDAWICGVLVERPKVHPYILNHFYHSFAVMDDFTSASGYVSGQGEEHRGLSLTTGGSMSIGLATLLLEAAVAGSSLLSYGAKKRGRRVQEDLSSTIQSLDVGLIDAELSDLRISTFMRGQVTVGIVKPILLTQEFRSTMREHFLSKVIAPEREFQDSSSARAMRQLILLGLREKSSAEDADFFAESFVEAVDSSCLVIIATARSANPEFFLNLQQGAVMKRALDVIQNIDSHLSRIEARASGPERSDWIAKYRQLCAKYHGYIVPPDFETNRRIKMQDLYVTPRLMAQTASAAQAAMPVSVDQFERSIDRTVLLGDPGGGKSTLSNYLTASWASKDFSPVPFHITLREFVKRKESVGVSVLDYILELLTVRFQHPARRDYVEDLLISGEAVVVFDGLDELIDTSLRREVSATVEMFAEKYPSTSLFVTSRRVGYEQARLDPEVFHVTSMAPFSDSDVEEYVQKWFSCQSDYTEGESATIAASFITQSEAVLDLRANPLMLALMCIIFRGENFIPRSRPIIYEKCASLLFDKWDGHRSIEVPLNARAHVDSAMKFIAFWMLRTGAGDLGVSRGELIKVMSGYLRDRAAENEEQAEKAATQFVDFCRGRAWVFSDAGTTAEGEPLFTFTHRTFMEYFAAYHLTRSSDSPERLARDLLPKVAAEEWDVVAQLAVQIADRSSDRGSERVLRTMLDEPRKRSVRGRSNVLSFISRCIGFSTVSPTFSRDLTRKVLENAFRLERRRRYRWSAPHELLYDVVPDNLRESITDEFGNVLRDRLRSDSGDDVSVAIDVISEMAFIALERMLNGLDKSDSKLVVFSELASLIPEGHASSPATRRRLTVPRLFGGEITAAEALGAFDDSGEANFYLLHATRDHDSIAPFGGSLFTALTGYLVSHAFRSGRVPRMDELAGLYLSSFWESREVAVDLRPEPPLPAMFFHYVPRGAGTETDRTWFNDACFIASLTQSEVMKRHFNNHAIIRMGGQIDQMIAQRMGIGSSEPEIDFSDLSDRMADFARAWARNEESVFGLGLVTSSDAGSRTLRLG